VRICPHGAGPSSVLLLMDRALGQTTDLSKSQFTHISSGDGESAYFCFVRLKKMFVNCHCTEKSFNKCQ
jgi:hypothetical protein